MEEFMFWACGLPRDFPRRFREGLWQDCGGGLRRAGGKLTHEGLLERYSQEKRCALKNF